MVSQNQQVSDTTVIFRGNKVQNENVQQTAVFLLLLFVFLWDSGCVQEITRKSTVFNPTAGVDTQ